VDQDIRWYLLALFLEIMCLIGGITNDTWFNLDGMSLGHPDPYLLAFLLLGIAVMAWAFAVEHWKNSGVMLFSNLGKTSLHKKEPVLVLWLPEELRRPIQARLDGMQDGPDKWALEAALGPYGVWVGEGVKWARMRGNAKMRVIVLPLALARFVREYVDVMAVLKDYYGHEQLQEVSGFPAWLMGVLCNKIHGFEPLVSDVWYGDRPDDGVVYAVGPDKARHWTRRSSAPDIDTAARMVFLDDLKVKLEVECATISQQIEEHVGIIEKLRPPQPVATPPAQPPPQPPPQERER
jgi:hypothetical protein